MKQEHPLQNQRGGNHPLARFTDEQARHIREQAILCPRSVRQLAAQYGCSPMTMWRLLHSQTYDPDCTS